MDFAALHRLSEEEGSLEKAEQQEDDKENAPPSRGKNVDKHSNNQTKRSAHAQTLSVTQYSPRQSLSIRVPKAKVDRSTQVRVLRFIHSKRTQERKRKLMFVVFSLILFAFVRAFAGINGPLVAASIVRRRLHQRQFDYNVKIGCMVTSASVCIM